MASMAIKYWIMAFVRKQTNSLRNKLKNWPNSKLSKDALLSIVWVGQHNVVRCYAVVYASIDSIQPLVGTTTIG